MYWYLSAFCIDSKFRPDISSKPFYICGFEFDAFFPREVFKDTFNFSAPLQNSPMYLPAIPILTPASPAQGTGSADLYLCNIFKERNLMSNSHICQAGTCFGFIIRICRIKRKPVLPRNANKRFRVQPACDLNKFNAVRQAFHKGKKFFSVRSKLKNVVNSYYLRHVSLDHVEDLLAAEHALMGNFPILEDSKSIPGKFPCPRRSTRDIDSIDRPFLHEHLYFIFCRIYI